MELNVNICIYIHIYMCIHICLNMSMYVFIHINIYNSIYIYIGVYAEYIHVELSPRLSLSMSN